MAKLGAGTLVLNAANSYTGVTKVADGALLLGNGGSMDATAVTVSGTADHRTMGTFTDDVADDVFMAKSCSCF